ncbi:MAG TPA: hypothetical protein VI636_03455 [Candidatus Angelobacter sp.]
MREFKSNHIRFALEHAFGFGERGLRLVAAAASRKANNPPNTRLEVGGYIADILVDRRHPSAICHWIVQKVGSAEILQWGQETTFDEAIAAAGGYLRDLAQKAPKLG